jgi:hypothetical protein
MLFHQEGPRAKLRRPASSNKAGGAATDHHKVVMVCCHGGRFNRRAGSRQWQHVG